MGALWSTAVSLRFFGDALDPEQVTIALGHPPDAGIRRGELWRPSRRGREVIARTGSWRREVPRREPGDLDDQIVQLLAPLTTDMAVWKHLTSSFEADIFCGLFLESMNEGLEISPQTLLAVGQRNLTLGLDIYGADDSAGDSLSSDSQM